MRPLTRAHMVRPASVESLAGDVDEGQCGVRRVQRAGRGERVVVRDLCVLRLAPADGGGAEAEQTGVEAGQLVLDGGVVGEVGVDDLAQLRVGGRQRSADDGEDFADLVVEEAGAQGAVPDQSGRSEDDGTQRRLQGVGQEEARVRLPAVRVDSMSFRDVSKSSWNAASAGSAW